MKKLLLSVFIFGAILSADPVSVTFVGTSDNPAVVNGFLAGPYYLQTGGNTIPAMCMNDNLEVYGGEQWQAYVTPVSGSDFSHTYLGNGGDTIGGYFFTSKQIYQAEAYLFSELLQPGADTGDIQLAAWAIRDSNTFASLNDTGTAFNYILDAYNNSPSFDATGYSILSDVTGSAQEFMCDPPTATPEPASVMIFGAGLVAIGAARFASRRKAQAVTA